MRAFFMYVQSLHLFKTTLPNSLRKAKSAVVKVLLFIFLSATKVKHIKKLRNVASQN